MKPTRRWLIVAIVIFIFGVSVILRGWYMESLMLKASKGTQKRERIIALAPSTTEILFALGLGERVVGVSKFVKYPAEAAAKPKVGGHFDPDMEALLSLMPDVVVLLSAEHNAGLESYLQSLNLGTIKVDDMSVGAILQSVEDLGEFFSKEEQAKNLLSELRGRIEKVKLQTANKVSPRVLVSISREVGTGRVRSLIAAGSDGYHQELLAILNAQNAYTGNVAFPELSREHMIQIDPDIIIDIVLDSEFAKHGREKLLVDWREYTELRAVKEGKVFVLAGDKHVISGPRFVETLEEMARMIHGETSDE